VGSFIRIVLGIEEGEPSSCGGAPRGVVLGVHKILSPPRVLRYQNLPREEILHRFLKIISKRSIHVLVHVLKFSTILEGYRIFDWSFSVNYHTYFKNCMGKTGLNLIGNEKSTDPSDVGTFSFR
jgi:hypothetical protein